MVLKDVLHILQKQVDSIGITNTLLYVMLFTDAANADADIYTEEAKKRFSNRGLTRNISLQYCNEEGFLCFTRKIEKKYLPLVKQHVYIYEQLKELVEKCEYLPTSYKKRLLSSCLPENDYQLARFIAACILCASYHTNCLNGKKNDIYYSFGIDFMNLDRQISSYPMVQEIWKASQRAFLISHREGNRFYNLDIIKHLLPKGYVTDNNFHMRARTEDGQIRSLMDICREDSNDIAVTGEGGIGKTTFLQQLLQDEFWDRDKNPSKYASGRPVPIFIELRRCPSIINEWYEDIYKKTNFITRYIGQMLENHSTLDSVSPEILTAVEKEMQRIPKDGIPEYLLLLDGFNEVSIAERGMLQSCRAMLSNEITVIHQEYPNIKIIATSRETQSAYFTSAFRNVKLIGVEEQDIKEHLEKCGFSDTAIGITFANKSLLKCLRIPLFLCMFSYERQANDILLPETQGEILYSFFHRKSFFYNTRKHAEDTHTNPLDELQTALVLDFILPYIGWVMEQNDIFSLSESSLIQAIDEGMDVIRIMLSPASSVPYSDFSYSAELLNIAFRSLLDRSDYRHKIIACTFDYLGILYQYNEPEKKITERRQYAFIHHYFRDYFSSILDIQLLNMLPFIDVSIFLGKSTDTCTYDRFLNSRFWNQGKKELISQILMEHRNKPKLNPVTENWYLPEFITDEQQILSNAVDFCRVLGQTHSVHYLLHNVLMAIVYGRQELSGMDLSGLNFKYCNIFSIPCCRKGASSMLAARFDQSVLPDYFLSPEDHVDGIEEYAYSGHYCYTLDTCGTIKCWDIFSGCLEYILQSGEPNGMFDYSSNGLMKISSDGKWLAAKVYRNEPDDQSGCLYIFNLERPEQKPYILQPEKKSRIITSFSFTFDNRSILYLSDRYDVYCFEIETQRMIYSHHFEEFLQQTELYAVSSESDIYVFSGEYKCFDSTDFYPQYDDKDSVAEEEDDQFYEEDTDFDDDWDENAIPVPCTLLKCNCLSGETEVLYNFTGESDTVPVAKYFPEQDCFILFNEQNKQLEYFSCSQKKSEIIWEELTAENENYTPSAIQYCPGHAQQCYIIYPQYSYRVDLVSYKQNGVLMKYNVTALSRLIDDDEGMEELIFYPNVIPNWNRFIIRNSENTYEWDTANDTVRRRYNTALYDSRDLIFDKIHHLGIFVHQFNGVSIFRGEVPKLLNAFCYPSAEYYVSGCCYHEATMNLALMFSKASHEYVEIINLRTSKREIVFSTLPFHETLKSIQFHPNGEYLLITLAGRCLEYQFSSEKSYLVDQAGKNELYLDGNYTNDETPMIQIAVAERFNYDEPHVEPHCDHYSIHHTSKKNFYIKEWRYYMPALTPETAKGFLHHSFDIGDGGSYTQEGCQTYWCSSGFFLHEYPEDVAFQHISCTRFAGKREQKIEKKFGKLQMLFCRHDFALANRYRTEKYCNTYAYCSEDISEVIQILEHRHIIYWHDLTTKPFAEKYVYNDGEKTSDELSYAYVDTLIPWEAGTLLACYEQYNLILLKKMNQGKSIEIPYSPGIAIKDCTFYGIKADMELCEVLKANGGKI